MFFFFLGKKRNRNARAVAIVYAEIESSTLGANLVVDGEMSDVLFSPGRLAQNVTMCCQDHAELQRHQKIHEQYRGSCLVSWRDYYI